MSKFLLFTTGGGLDDITNLSRDEVALYNSVDLRSIKPTSNSTIEIIFKSGHGNEVVTLTIKRGSHTKVMRSIAEAINSGDSLIKIADVDGESFIDRNITGVSINAHTNYTTRLSNNSRTQIAVPRGNWDSCMISNIDGTDAVNLTLELYDGSTWTALLSTISIPADTTLKLESNEISFDNSTYNLWATSGDSDGMLTFTFNY
jgi:hypothetical protein